MAEPVSTSSEKQQRNNPKTKEFSELDMKVLHIFNQIRKYWQLALGIIVILLGIYWYAPMLLDRDGSPEVDKLKKTNHDLIQENEKLYNDTARLRNEKGVLQDERFRQKEEIASLKEKVGALVRDNSELQSQVEKCKQLEIDLFEEIMEHDQCFKELNGEGTLFGLSLNLLGYKVGTVNLNNPFSRPTTHKRRRLN